MKLLYINSNPKLVEHSKGRQIGEKFLESFKQSHPEVEITTLNLYEMDIPELDIDVITGWDKLGKGMLFENLTTLEQEKITKIDQLTMQFVDAEYYVFVSPLWNLSFPAKLKAYIDTVIVAGKTFKYTENGAEGLLSGKKAVHIQTRGGVYSEGPMKELEFGDRYIKSALQFLGIDVLPSIIAEGMDHHPEQAEQIISRALDEAATKAIEMAEK